MESSLWYYVFRDVRFPTSGDKAVSKLKKARDKAEKGQTVLSVVAILDEMLVVLTSSYGEDGVLRYRTHRYVPVGGDWYGEDVLWFHSEPIQPNSTTYPFLSFLTEITKQFYPTKDCDNNPAKG